MKHMQQTKLVLLLNSNCFRFPFQLLPFGYALIVFVQAACYYLFLKAIPATILPNSSLAEERRRPSLLPFYSFGAFSLLLLSPADRQERVEQHCFDGLQKKACKERPPRKTLIEGVEQFSALLLNK